MDVSTIILPGKSPCHQNDVQMIMLMISMMQEDPKGGCAEANESGSGKKVFQFS